MRRCTLVQLVAICVLVLGAGVAYGLQDAVADNKEAGRNADGVVKACEMAGATQIDVASSDDRTNSNGGSSTHVVSCKGGGMGGVTCAVDNSGIYCGWRPPGTKSMVDGGLQEIAINVQDVTFASELPADAANPLVPEVASQPMLVEAVITWNLSAEAANQAGLDLVNGCRQLGGTELVTHPDGNPESASFTVQCQDGILNGMWCGFGIGLNSCFFAPESTSAAETAESPTATATAVEPTVVAPTQPSSATTTPTPTATVPSPTPTIPTPTMPAPTATVAPVEPTAEPPSGPWQPPQNIGTLPPIEVAPTPTPLPLT